MISKGRDNRAGQKLTFEQATEIRETYANRTTLMGLSKKYGISKRSIIDILAGKTYQIDRSKVLIKDQEAK